MKLGNKLRGISKCSDLGVDKINEITKDLLEGADLNTPYYSNTYGFIPPTELLFIKHHFLNEGVVMEYDETQFDDDNTYYAPIDLHFTW